VVNKRSQRGVLIFATPLILVLIGVFVTLLIDGARLASVRSEMQSIANVAASAAADQSQSCTDNSADFARMQSQALAAARAAGFDGQDSDLQVIPGVLSPNTDGELVFSARQSDTQMAQTNATRVVFTRNEPVSSLFPEAVISPISITVDATARKEAVAILSATGATATVDGGLLGSLIGGLTGIPNYELDPTDLQSLSNTLVGVGDLLAALGIDDVTDLVDVPVIDLLNATMSIVGGVASPVGGIVDNLTGAVGLSGLDASAIFDVVGSPYVSEGSTFPVYDLVISAVLNSVQVANQTGMGLLSLGLESSESPLLGGLVGALGLLGDVDLTLDLLVNQPPQIVIGPARQGSDGEWLTTVSAADIALATAIDIELATSAVGGLINALSLGLVNVSVLDRIQIPLIVEVGGGDATFVGADCAAGDNNSVNLDFQTVNSAATIETGRLNGTSGGVTSEAISATILRLRALFLDINVCLDAELDVAVDVAEGTGRLESYELFCPDGQCQTQPVSQVSNLGGGGLDIEVENLRLDCGQGGLTGLVSTILGGLVSPLTIVLSEVTEVVLGDIVSPLLAGLGADLGGVKVKVLGVDQTSSQLVENLGE
tara:strand:+ start:21877 stop:23682 length:1806 start_codon:yes stop_codon:yes gene_type:complete